MNAENAMTADLQSKFAAIESQRESLQTRVRGLTDAQLIFKPDPAAWSIGQIVEHLVRSDETVGRARSGTVPYVEVWMFRVLPRAARRAMVISALNRDKTLPLPSPDLEPTGTTPLPALLARWDSARAEMRRILETLRGDEQPYAHPVLGPLTAVQMLDLEYAHTAYHARQVAALQSRDTYSPGNG